MRNKIDAFNAPSPKNKLVDVEKVSAPTVLVILGATGDLMARKISPALHNLYHQGYCPDQFRVIGFARRPFSDKAFRSRIRENLKQYASNRADKQFLNLFSYHQGDFTTKAAYKVLAKKLSAIDKERGASTNKLFYLAVPPQHYETIFSYLAASGLMNSRAREKYTRMLVEKPFGKDLDHAVALERQLNSLFKEEQIYRIDHYLAKEAVQSILSFRFSNNLLELGWGKQAIDRIDIKLLEDIDIEGRGAFYEGVGAFIDVGQNHVLQMLALVTMDQPAQFSAKPIREQRAKILKTILPVKDCDSQTVRAQYDGYCAETGVDPKSQTETYFRIRAELNHPNWKGVPIYLEGGKALHKVDKQIIVTFKHPRPCLCPPGNHFQNQLFIRIQPDPGIAIRFWNKKPGTRFELEEEWLKFEAPLGETKRYQAEYTQLLLDAMRGDQTSFLSSDEALASWRFVDPIIRFWRGHKFPLYGYKKKGSIAHVAEKVERERVQFKREIGIVGLGKMGHNLALSLQEKGWRVIGYQRTRLQDSPIEQAGALEDLANKLTAPRLVWLMVPHTAVDEVLLGKQGLTNFLQPGDFLIEGGNSFYQDTIRRSKKVSERKINFVDAGVSGGPAGARLGACLMIGGDKKHFNYLEPLFKDIATQDGYQYFSGTGAGHFVKMIHNGIEYGMMQAIAEGFNILKHSKFKLKLRDVSNIYNHGSVVESRLLAWLNSAFNHHAEDLKNVSGKVGHTGEGAWTVEEAKRLRLKAKIIEESLKFRQQSEKDPSYTGKILSVLREQFGGHSVKIDK